MRPSRTLSLAVLLFAVPALAAAQELARTHPLSTNTVLGCWRLSSPGDSSRGLADVGLEVRTGGPPNHVARPLFRSDESAWSHQAEPGEWTEPIADSVQVTWADALFHLTFAGRLVANQLHGRFTMSHDYLDGTLVAEVAGYRLDCSAFPPR